MKFRPLHDRVVVKRIDAEEKTVRRHHHSRHRQREALAGRDRRRRPGWPRRGRQADPDRPQGRRHVLFGKWSGTEVKIDGQDLLIMKESDVMGVIEGTVAAKKKAA